MDSSRIFVGCEYFSGTLDASSAIAGGVAIAVSDASNTVSNSLQIKIQFHANRK